jgi:hypothetical protein
MRPRVIVHAPRADAGPVARELEVHGETHALVPLGDAVHGELYWEQPRMFRREWRLVSERGEHLLLHGNGITRRKLTAETPTTSWALHRTMLGVVTLADAEGRVSVTIPHGWFGRWRVELESGPALAWRRRWNYNYTLADEEGHELLRLVRRFAFFRFQVTVSVSDAARTRADLTELLAVTFFACLSRPRGHAH